MFLVLFYLSLFISHNKAISMITKSNRIRVYYSFLHLHFNSQNEINFYKNFLSHFWTGGVHIFFCIERKDITQKKGSPVKIEKGAVHAVFFKVEHSKEKEFQERLEEATVLAKITNNEEIESKTDISEHNSGVLFKGTYNFSGIFNSEFKDLLFKGELEEIFSLPFNGGELVKLDNIEIILNNEKSFNSQESEEIFVFEVNMCSNLVFKSTISGISIFDKMHDSELGTVIKTILKYDLELNDSEIVETPLDNKPFYRKLNFWICLGLVFVIVCGVLVIFKVKRIGFSN